MVTGREMYRVESACRLIVKGAHSLNTVLVADYGLPEYASGSYLELFGFASSLYEFSSMPYFDASDPVLIAIQSIGKGIEEGGEWADITSLTDVFGSSLGQFRSLLELPNAYNSEPGKRAEYIRSVRSNYISIFDVAFSTYANNFQHANVLNKIAQDSSQMLSTRLYGYRTISEDFYKNQYAFFQSVIENQYQTEQRIFD
ncbi:hypothetical protein HQ496_03920 [bacterium]|nr:hypothetical protein [bacterium]